MIVAYVILIVAVLAIGLLCWSVAYGFYIYNKYNFTFSYQTQIYLDAQHMVEDTMDSILFKIKEYETTIKDYDLSGNNIVRIAFYDINKALLLIKYYISDNHVTSPKVASIVNSFCWNDSRKTLKEDLFPCVGIWHNLHTSNPRPKMAKG